MARGERTENHPGRQVSRASFQTGDPWDPAKIEAGRKAGLIKTHKDYPPRTGPEGAMPRKWMTLAEKLAEPDDE